ncbi:MAG: hypothetical protein EOO76_10615 [Novosphingobium sp.]|nr:MAG: hypothetical protein EOO76_10615 [Novosphingobium sp.]
MAVNLLDMRWIDATARPHPTNISIQIRKMSHGDFGDFVNLRLPDHHDLIPGHQPRRGIIMAITFNQEEQDADVEAFFDEPAFEERALSCWGIGPLEVCATKVAADRVDVDIKLTGVRIGSGTLTAANSSICASASVAIVKAKVCVTADFPGQVVWVEGKVCTRKFPSGWSCRGFKSKILAW